MHPCIFSFHFHSLFLYIAFTLTSLSGELVTSEDLSSPLSLVISTLRPLLVLGSSECGLGPRVCPSQTFLILELTHRALIYVTLLKVCLLF
jgi:hypothetical protein